MKQLAKEKANSLEYWYRRKYNLPLHDPRFLECEEWEIELEYETDKALNESLKALRNVCPKCGLVVYGNFCDRCQSSIPTEHYYDPDYEKYLEKIEKGESFKDPGDWVEEKEG